MSLLVHYINAVGIWSINPYRRCAHCCRYCIAGSQGESTPWYGADEVIPALRAGLSRVPADVELFIGALVDAYPPAERDYGVTRLIIEELIQQHRPFCINTKSDMVCRDIDLLSGYSMHCDVYLSLCSLSENALRVLEPGAPSAARRMQALHVLHTAGIEVQIDAAPWIPGVSDAAALIGVRPAGVGIQFAPLDLSHRGNAMTLLGHQLTQQEVNAAYQCERDRIGEAAGVVWKPPR